MNLTLEKLRVLASQSESDKQCFCGKAKPAMAAYCAEHDTLRAKLERRLKQISNLRRAVAKNPFNDFARLEYELRRKN